MRFDTVKGLVALGVRDRVKEQFPEYFNPFEDAQRDDGSYDIDRVEGSQVKWSSAGSEDEDAELARWIAQRERGSMTAAEME